MNKWFEVNIVQKFNKNRATTFSSRKAIAVDPKNSPDVKQFKKMVEKLNYNDPTDDAVEFFSERFKNYKEDVLLTFEIEKEATKLIDVFSTGFLSHIADFTVRIQGLSFLEKACQLYDYTSSEENRLVLIVSEIANTNNKTIIESATQFVTKLTSLPKNYPMLFTGENLCLIWNSVFKSNIVPSEYFGPLFIKAAKEYMPPNVGSIIKFLDNVSGTFEVKAIKEELQGRAIEFVGAVIYQLDTKEFVSNFFALVKDDLTHIQDYQPLHNLLIAKSSESNTIWPFFNTIMQEPDVSLDMKLNALKTVYLVREHEEVYQFDLMPYVEIAPSLEKEYQRYLFETAAYYPIDQRLEIFKQTFPPLLVNYEFAETTETAEQTPATEEKKPEEAPKEEEKKPEETPKAEESQNAEEKKPEEAPEEEEKTPEEAPKTESETKPEEPKPDVDNKVNYKVDAEMLSLMVTQSDWSGHYDEMASLFVENSDFPTLYVEICKNRWINEICSYVFLHVSQDWADASDCIKAGLDISMIESDKSLKTIEAIATNVNPDLYIEVLIDYLQRPKVNALVFNVFGKISCQRKDFVKSFINHKGLDALSGHLAIVPCLDFIALLASDGPHEPIDRFICNNDFSALDEHDILNLMYGVHQDAEELAVLRIPSLWKYIKKENRPQLETVFDKYVFGKYAEKYISPDQEELMTAAHTYMSKDTAERFLKSPETLLELLSNIEPRGNLYQFHPRVPQNTAFIRSSGAISFWVYVQKNNAKTPLFTVAGQTLYIEDCRFDLNGLTQDIKLNQWYMVTFVTKSLNPLQPTTQVYIDTILLYTISGKGDIQIGGPGQKSIWYMEEKVTDSSSVSEESLRETYELGPHSSKTTITLDLLYVPYGGIIANFPAYGGNDIFWNACFQCHEEVHMLKMIQSAFSLAQSGVFTMDELFKGFKATFIQRPDLLTTNIAESLVESSMKDSKSSPELLRRLFGSFFYLAAPNVNHKTLPEVIDKIADPSDILNILLLAIIFFELEEETVNKFEEVIAKVVKIKPALISQLLTFARGLPYIDEDEIKTPDDPRCDGIQDKLIDIAIDAGFPQRADEILDSFLTLSHRQAFRLFKIFTKKCIANPNFFDAKSFTQMEPGLHPFVSNEELWVCLLSLVSETEISTLKEFNIAKKEVDVDQLNMAVVHTVINLTSVLMQKDLNNPMTEQIVKIVCGIVIDLTAKGEDLIPYFAPLCAIGYNEYELTPFPLSKANDDSIKGIDSASPKKLDIVNVDDMSLVEDIMHTKETACPEAKYRPKEEVNFDDRIVIAREISKTASSILAMPHIANNLSAFKKALYMLTVMGADVNNSVAMIMHRSIISDFIPIWEERQPDVLSFFTDFIGARLMEGWWQDSEMLIIDQIIRLLPTNTLNFFVVALIAAPSDSIECIIKSQVFSGFTREEENCALLADVIIKMQSFPHDYLELIKNTALNSKFRDALKKDSIKDYMKPDIEQKAKQARDQCLSQIKKEEPALFQARYKNSSKPPSPLYEHRRNLSSFICRQYMKRKFAIVYNMNCLDSEEIIGRVFVTQQQQKYFLMPSDKYCVQRSSSPFSVPSKVVPLTYEFISPHQRQTKPLQFVMSQHATYLNFTVESMNHNQSASQCLEGTHLPLYIYDDIVCAKVFMEKFGVQTLFQCSLYMSSELLPCVGAITKERFILLMNAQYSDGGLKVNKGSNTLCHFEPLEDSTSGIWGQSTLFFHNPVLLMDIDGIAKLERRRFAYDPRAVDIFMCDGRHITLVMDENDRKTFISKVKAPKDEGLLSIPIADLQKMWCSGEITTFDYLLAVNNLGGRSFNDFSQYPVFPWVIGDYTHDPPEKMRDLSKPMGMQTEERGKRFIAAYEETPEHYNYGTHYSHPAAVFHFMLRIEPYTLFFFHLHNGWDHRDRIFCDVNDSWLSASEANQTDLKELLPEFFMFPGFLINQNDIPILDRTDGKKISNVILPPWGKEPLQFIWRNRIALEHEDISPWLDLIFGCKSRGQGAKDANNVFTPLTYSKVNTSVEMELQGKIDTINNFGQCPIQVFNQPHPKLNRVQLETIANRQPYINLTKLITPEGATKVYDEEGEIIFTGPGESRLGFSRKRIDECVSYTNSPDSSMVAVASPHGLVTITFALNYKSKVIALPGAMPRCLCLPKIGHFLLVSTDTHLYLFDIASGFLSLQKELPGIKALAYDDISHCIFAMTEKSVHCLYVDFTDIAVGQLNYECRSICDSARTSFDEKPFFAVGLANGHVAIMELDILAKKCSQISDHLVCDHAIVSLKIVANGGAIIALDETSQAYALSPSKIGRKFVQAELYDSCISCGEKKPQPIGGVVTVAIGSGICTQCGRYNCAKCLLKGVCEQCRNETTRAAVQLSAMPQEVEEHDDHFVSIPVHEEEELEDMQDEPVQERALPAEEEFIVPPPQEVEEEQPKEEEPKKEEKPKQEEKKRSDSEYSGYASDDEDLAKKVEEPKKEEVPKTEVVAVVEIEEPKKEEPKKEEKKKEESSEYEYYSDESESEKKDKKKNEEPKKEEPKPEPVKEEPKKEELKPEPVVVEVKEEPKPEPKKEEKKEPSKKDKKKDDYDYYSDEYEYYSDEESESDKKKEKPKPEPAPVKEEPKKEEKKKEPKKEEPKPVPKKEEPKPEPVKAEKKESPKKDKKKDGYDYYSDEYEYYSDEESDKKKNEKKKDEKKKEEPKPEPAKEEKKEEPKPKKEEPKPEPIKEEPKKGNEYSDYESESEIHVEPKPVEKPKKEESKPVEEPKREESKPAEEPKKEENPKEEAPHVELAAKKEHKHKHDKDKKDHKHKHSKDKSVDKDEKEKKEHKHKHSKDNKDKKEHKHKHSKDKSVDKDHNEGNDKSDDKKEHRHHRSKHRSREEGGKHEHKSGKSVHHAHKNKK